MNGNEKLKKVKLALLSMIRHQWEHGTAAQAFIDSGDDDIAILMAHESVFRQTPEGVLAYVIRAHNITDPCVCGESVVFAYEKTGEEKYKIAAEKMLHYIDNAPRSAEGMPYHNTSSSLIFADCTYMVAPFYAVMKRYDEAVRQIDLRFRLLWSEEKGAIQHMWDDATHTFKRDKIWGAASGWNAAGIVRVLKMLPPEMKAEKERLSHYLEKIVSGILKYQLDNGLFYDVLDEGETSFVETNCAQMIAYSIYRGVTGGYLDKKYIPAADRMRAAANDKVDHLGLVQGVAGAPAFNFYGVSPEGQAFYILMEAAASDYEKIS